MLTAWCICLFLCIAKHWGLFTADNLPHLFPLWLQHSFSVFASVFQEFIFALVSCSLLVPVLVVSHSGLHYVLTSTCNFCQCLFTPCLLYVWVICKYALYIYYIHLYWNKACTKLFLHWNTLEYCTWQFSKFVTVIHWVNLLINLQPALLLFCIYVCLSKCMYV